MRKVFTLFVVALFASFTANAQVTQAAFAPAATNAEGVGQNGGGGANYRNALRAGVSISVLHQGWAKADVEAPVFPTDYPYPQWDFTWHWDNLYDPGSDLTGNTPTLLLPTTDGGDGVVNASTASHVPTRSGLYFAGIDADGRRANNGVASGKSYFRLNTYGGGGDPAYVENITKLREYLGTPLNHPDFSAPLNALDSAAACIVKLSETNNAMAFYPGKFAKTDFRFTFNFNESHPSSDITFKLLQVDKGTTGNDMKYKMVVSIAPFDPDGADTNAKNVLGTFQNISGANVTNFGCDKTDSASVYGNVGPYRYEFADVMVANGSQSGELAAPVTINLAEKIKTVSSDFTTADLARKRITIAIVGEAANSGAIVEAGGVEHKYNPVVAFDDLHFSYWRNWYQANNSGLTEHGENPPTGIRDIAVSTTKVIGKKGQIEIIGAQAAISVYSITGQKVASFVSAQEYRTVSVPAGVYIVAEKDQLAVKVIVR
jgi:hypothetical protein